MKNHVPHTHITRACVNAKRTEAAASKRNSKKRERQRERASESEKHKPTFQPTALISLRERENQPAAIYCWLFFLIYIQYRAGRRERTWHIQ